jgi:hypothetical protein
MLRTIGRSAAAHAGWVAKLRVWPHVVWCVWLRAARRHHIYYAARARLHARRGRGRGCPQGIYFVRAPERRRHNPLLVVRQAHNIYDR